MSYEQRLQAVGRLIDQARMRDVCVLEFPAGVLVVGLSPIETSEETLLRSHSQEFDNDLIEKTIADLAREQAQATAHSDDTVTRRTATSWLGRTGR
jgi:hypothetical protein